MGLRGMVFCLLVWVFGGPVAKAAEAVPICPITNDLLTALRAVKNSAMTTETPGDFIGTTDSIFLSAAELSGYLDGDPKLTFGTGDQKLASGAATCLKSFAQIYALAAGGGTVAKGVTIRLIGHADATGVVEKNFALSYSRAAHGKTVLEKALSASKAPPPSFLVEGHGGADLWWCGIESDRGAPVVAQEACSSFGSGPEALDENLKQRNDRHLEIRVEGPLIAGPRLDLVRENVKYHPISTDLHRLAAFESRLRYFPAGTTPLAPVQIALGDLENAKDTKERLCWKAAVSWKDGGWRHVGPWSTDDKLVLSKLEPEAIDARRFDEAQLYIRIRPVPVVLDKGIRKVRLMVELATGTVGPLIAGGTDNATPAFTAMKIHASLVASAPVARRSLGLGIPDYWRVRLRVEQGLADWANGLRDEAETTGLPNQPWLDLAPCLKLLPEKDHDAAKFAAFAAAKVLTGLPRDFDGLLGTAHDFNRPARMFGLRPGNKLQLDFGQLSLIRSDKDKKETIALLGGEKTFDLFAAPLAIGTTRKTNEAGIAARMAARAGPYAHLAVTINPFLQGMWSGQPKVQDPEALPTPVLSPSGVFNLANSYALERFLRGRIVNVFLPTFQNDTGKGAANAITEAQITSSTEQAANSSRDPIFVAATSPAELAALYLGFAQDTVKLADEADSLCSTLKDWTTMCGFMRSDVAPALLVPTRVQLTDRFLPLDARIGSIIPQAKLAKCFLPSGSVRTESDFEPFSPESRLPSPIAIKGLGPEFAPPKLYDGRDCRMLSLPILGGGEYQW
jgi:hypothetical protein